MSAPSAGSSRTARLSELEGEPWRFICPKCGSHAVVKAYGSSRPLGKRYPMNGNGKQLAEADRRAKWRCDACSARLDTVYDKKAGSERLIRVVRS